jgi:hypothetical protein
LGFEQRAAASPVDADAAAMLATEIHAIAYGHHGQDSEEYWDRSSWTVRDLRTIADQVAEQAGISREALLAKTRARLVTGLEKQRSELHVAEWRQREAIRKARQNLLPLAHEADKLVRYEGHLERCLYKALHELQRLQAARQGEKVPAPAALDVTLDGGFVPQRRDCDDTP